MGPYIVDIFSLPPSKWLGIANGTCVGKCPKSMHLLVQMGSNKIRHSFPFCVKCWGMGHKNSRVFSDMAMTYSQSSLGCVTQSMLTFSTILGKLSRNISNILSHDVKLCDWNLPFSQYSACILTNSISINVTHHTAKYIQDACNSNFIWSPSQMFQHFFDIVPSYQSTFDGSIQCLPQNSNVIFLLQWPLWVPLVVLIAKWQHFVLAQDTLFGMQPIFHIVHCALMAPLEVAFALRPFPFTTPPKHVLQCWLVLWMIIC